MNIKSPQKEFDLPIRFQARLNAIVQAVPEFWKHHSYHQHFTNHGPEHSERVYSQKLAQLALELPEAQRLIPEEIFIVSAAAWLYEIGMQSTTLKSVLNFDYHFGDLLSFSQLQLIRANKHLLTQRMIIDSVRQDYQGPPLELGLTRPADEYTHLIAEVCRWCCDEPLEKVPENWPVGGIPIRVRLLVALLRLADQLYIDSSRVNLDLLDVADLPIAEYAKWWAYHYTQILPITGGKIQFHYFMPSRQKQYLGHIRALIEPNFEYRNNAIIQYLSDQYERHLIPRTQPTFKFDQPDGFQREMSEELVWFLRREIQSVPTDTTPEGSIPSKELEGECLLVLDYENFLMQLGREGYFFTLDEISQHVVTLRSEVKRQYDGVLKALAIGHWDRPDLSSAAQMLNKRVYDLITLQGYESSSEKIEQELEQRLQAAERTTRIIVVTPDADLARSVQSLIDRKFVVDAWISHSLEVDIYRSIVQNPKYIQDLLQLSDPSTILPEQLESHQAACILRLDDAITSNKGNIPFDKVEMLLEQIDRIKIPLSWWQLWLVNQGILIVKNVNGQSFAHLNSEHPVVARVRNMRQITIEALQELSSESKGVQQDQLFQKLERSSSDFGHEEITLEFLGLLKDEDLVYRDARPSLSNVPLWQLNPAHWAVITLNPNRYLQPFALAFDQALLQKGHIFAQKRFLPEYLSPYFETSILETIYDLALSKGLIHVREKEVGGRIQEHITLVEEHPQTAEVFRNRNILLNILNHSSARDGKTQGALWQQLKSIIGFTLNRQEFEQLLGLFQKGSVVTIVESNQDPERNIIKLNLESLSTQLMLGRMNLCGLVYNLRRMRATGPSKKKPSKELVDKLSRFVTYHSDKEAQWTLDYARIIRLVDLENGQVSLNFWHNFVRGLDDREESVCEAAAQLVKRLSRPGNDGWVPRFVVLQEMSRSTQFGYDRKEHNYWLDQAIGHLRLLEKDRKEINGRQQDVLRVLEKA